MTTAPPGLLEARALLLAHLDMHPGQTVSADLDPAEVGIVGNLTLRWAQQASSASATTLLAGSWIRLRRVS